MKRWIRMAARLYPSRWRQRYGPEFDALLEDTRPTLKNALNVAWGALEMHMNMVTFPKLAILCGLTGAILAAVMAVRMPDKYVSEAVIRVSADGQGLRFFRDRVLQLGSKPDISITNAASLATRPNEFDFTLRYSHRDAAQAQRTATERVSSIMKANVLAAIKVIENSAQLPPRTQVRLLSPPRLAASLDRPNRPLITALGFGAGLLLASLLAVAKRLLRVVQRAGSY